MKEIQVHIGKRNKSIQAKLTGYLLGEGGGVDLTAENIADALGYVPADQEDVEKLSEKIDDKLDSSELSEAINTALAQAKESGEFDGKDGQDGIDGADGETPIKGTDYFTEADKQEIIDAIYSQVVDGNEVAY